MFRNKNIPIENRLLHGLKMNGMSQLHDIGQLKPQLLMGDDQNLLIDSVINGLIGNSNNESLKLLDTENVYNYQNTNKDTIHNKINHDVLIEETDNIKNTENMDVINK